MLNSLRLWRSNFSKKGLFNKQVKVFLILFLGYASLHCMRTGWSFIQKYMQDDLTDFTDTHIGIINTSFLLFLGIGLYLTGSISDKFNPKSFMLVGMVLSAMSLVSISIFRIFFIEDPYLYAILQGFNGIFESACLPAYMRLLGNWFFAENRGSIIGIWSGSRSFGDALGFGIGDLLILHLNFSWYWSLIIFGMISLIISYLIYEFVSETPSSTGLATIVEDDCEEGSVVNPSILIKAEHQNPTGQKQQKQQNTNMDIDDIEKLREKLLMKYGASNVMSTQKAETEYPRITALQALKIPGVIWYTLDFMCLKALNYGILFWFPKYLQSKDFESRSSGITILWSFGVILGGIISGHIGDRMRRRRGIIMLPSLFLLIGCLAWYNSLDATQDQILEFYLVSFLIGIFLGGPYNVQHGPLIIELGKHSALVNQQAVGTVTGIIEGAGSLSSSLVQIIIPYFGQEKIFVIFMVLSFFAIICIIPIAIEDYQYLKSKPSFFKKTERLQTLPSIISLELRDLNSKMMID